VTSREFGPTDATLMPASPSAFRVTLESAGGGLSYVPRQFSRLLQIVLVVVGLVLLAACLNVASLLVARASTRAKDVAVCLAMGATWRPILRQFVSESLLLGLMGGLCGLLVAGLSRRVLLSLVSLGFVTVNIELPIDARVLAFTAAVSIFTGLLLGILPASQLRSLDLNSTLKSEAAGQTVTRKKLRLRRLLVVMQVAISLVLVIAAGLLVKSLYNVRAMGPGFDVQNVLMVDVRPLSEDTTAAPPEVVHRWLADALGPIRGVVSVSDSWLPLFTRDDMYAPMLIEGYAPRAGESMNIRFNCVSPHYFQSLGIGLLRGRAITDDDLPSAAPVAVVNEALAARYFPGQDPIGRILRIDYPTNRRNPMTIVGLVRDSQYNDLRQAVKPMIYLSIFQHPRAARSIEIRTAVAPATLIPQVRGALRALGTQLPVRDIRTMVEQVERPLARERLIAQLLAFFSVLCLLLTCIGIYGLIAYSVEQRTKEIGLRMAIGAERRGILWLVVRDALLLISIGILLGLPLALVGSQVLAAFLIGLQASDPMIALVSSLLVLASGALAGFAPGRTASLIEPGIALRHE
jgi:predicted permease